MYSDAVVASVFIYRQYLYINDEEQFLVKNKYGSKLKSKNLTQKLAGKLDFL